MDGSKEIWSFVERKLRVPIPPYIKNVLKFCGYESSHAIATIEEPDFQYFETEVRKGTIVDFFKSENSTQDGTKDGGQDGTNDGTNDGKKYVLEGSSKTVENFEFARGHRVLLMKAAKLVKERLEENRIDQFSATPKKTSKKRTVEKETDKTDNSDECRKNRKYSTRELLKELSEETEEEIGLTDSSIDPHIKHHKTVLLLKSLVYLKAQNPEMNEEMLQSIKTKMSADSVRVTKKPQKELSQKPLYTAAIKCPYCHIDITVFHKASTSEYGSWNAYSFERHLINVHKGNKQKIEQPKRIKTEESLNEDEDDKKDIPVTQSLPPSFPSQDVINKNKGEEDYIFVIVPPVLPSEVIVEDMKDIAIENASVEMPANIEDIDFKLPEIKDTTEPEHLILFQNGYQAQYKNKTITTYNTCGFDSIFAIYACLYFDSPNFRQHLDVSNFFCNSKFTDLVYQFFEQCLPSNEPTTTKLKHPSVWSKLYNDRNIILAEIFTNNINNYNNKASNLEYSGETTYINCKTGIGFFYSQLCTEISEIIGSVIEKKTCFNCDVIKTKVLTFLSIDIHNLDLKDIEKSIDLNFSKDRICKDCNGKYIFKRIFNNILALEVEPICNIQYQRKYSLQDLSQIINVGKEYNLSGVIQFDPILSHFTSHVKRKNGQWKVYDDLNTFEMNSDITKEILPYMLFYVTETYDDCFKSGLQKQMKKVSINESSWNAVEISKTSINASVDMPADIEDIDFKPPEVKDTTEPEHIILFQNGYQTQYKSKTIATYNTCAFDSIFAVYACFYLDSLHFRLHLDVSNFFCSSKFTDLVYEFLEKKLPSNKSTTTKLKHPSVWSKLYNDRNIILAEIFTNNNCNKESSNVRNSEEITYINCKTGIGIFYSQLCTEISEIIGSVIEKKICFNCDVIKTKVLPFLSIDIPNLDLKNIQKSINLNFSKDRLCKDCKGKYTFKRILNNILALEVEPNCVIQCQKKHSLQDLTQLINVGKVYNLCAVIQFDPVLDHFTSHVKRKNGQWKIYDDRNCFEVNSDLTKEILPYMLFYVTETYDGCFKSGLQNRISKVSTSECTNAIGNSKNSIKINKKIKDDIKPKLSTKTNSLVSASNATMENWKKEREKKWKY